MSYESKIVATGTWFYDRTVPRKIEVRAKDARFSSTRYNDDERLDENRPIPTTPDGLVYFCVPGGCEGKTLDEAKKLVDGQPWGPVKWD